MKTNIESKDIALLLKSGSENIAVILLENGQGVDISKIIEQAVADHFCYDEVKISTEPPALSESGCIAISRDYTITASDNRTMLFSVDLFEKGEEEPVEIYDIKAELITVYPNKE